MFVDLDDYNRVKLDMVHMPEYTDYVNASYIHVTSVILIFLLLKLVNRYAALPMNLILHINVCKKKVEKRRKLKKIFTPFLKGFYILID